MTHFENRRLEYTRTFTLIYADASGDVKDIVDAILIDLEIDPEPDGDTKLPLEGTRPNSCTSASENVIVVYWLPADHPVTILVDLVWL